MKTSGSIKAGGIGHQFKRQLGSAELLQCGPEWSA